MLNSAFFSKTETYGRTDRPTTYTKYKAMHTRLKNVARLEKSTIKTGSGDEDFLVVRKPLYHKG